MSRYEVATCRCPHCGRTFRVLADEVGTHSCPRCGYFDDPVRMLEEPYEELYEPECYDESGEEG